MTLEPLHSKIETSSNKKVRAAYNSLKELLIAIEHKGIPQKEILAINDFIKVLNNFEGTDKKLIKLLHKTSCGIISLLEKELKYVPKNHYKNLWTVLGMSVFGLPMGVVFSSILGNYAYIGIGLPIGLVIGMTYGTKLDKKAALDNLQLDITR